MDVLDTACARVRISLAAAPEALERLRGEIAEGERQGEAMRRDLDAGLNIDHEALDALETRLVAARAELEQVETRWSIQRDLAERLLEQRKLCAAARLAGDAEETDEPRASLEELESELRALQALSLIHI